MSTFAKIIEVDGNQLLVQKTFDEPDDTHPDDAPSFCLSFTTVHEGVRLESKYFMKTEAIRYGAFDHFDEPAAMSLLAKLHRIFEEPELIFDL